MRDDKGWICREQMIGSAAHPILRAPCQCSDAEAQVDKDKQKEMQLKACASFSPYNIERVTRFQISSFVFSEVSASCFWQPGRPLTWQTSVQHARTLLQRWKCLELTCEFQ